MQAHLAMRQAAAVLSRSSSCRSRSRACGCGRPWQQQHRQALLVVAMARPWRPAIDDVDRLSKGDGAKVRGTGNFNIPHRLNSDERPVYEAAKKKGFLAVRGSGYRKGRRGNPLPNVYRQWCDARGRACIVIEQDAAGGGEDVVVVDLAPLRTMQLAQAMRACCSLADAAGAQQLTPAQRPLDAVPFNTLPPASLPYVPAQLLYPGAGPSGAAAGAAAPPTPEAIAAAEAAVLQQADAVRQLKEGGLGNSDPQVQQQVQELLALKAQLQQLLQQAAAQDEQQQEPPPSGAASDGEQPLTPAAAAAREVLDEAHPFATVAIWQLPPLPLFFSCERPAAKALAKELAAAAALGGASKAGGRGGSGGGVIPAAAGVAAAMSA